jgi:hypothetical protein
MYVCVGDNRVGPRERAAVLGAGVPERVQGDRRAALADACADARPPAPPLRRARPRRRHRLTRDTIATLTTSLVHKTYPC